MDNEPVIVGSQEKSSASYHTQVFDGVCRELAQGATQQEQLLAQDIRSARGNDGLLLDVIRKPVARQILLGQGDHILQGVMGRMYGERKLPQNVLVPVAAFVESVTRKTYRNAKEGSGIIKHLAERLADSPSSEMRADLLKMESAVKFFNKWAMVLNPEAQSFPSSSHEMHLRGAFGEAFTLLMLKKQFPTTDVHFSDQAQDMQGIDIAIKSKKSGTTLGACGIKAKAGLSSLGGVNIRWSDRFGRSRSIVAPVNQIRVRNAQIYYGGVIVEHPTGADPRMRYMGKEPAGQIRNSPVTDYLEDAANSFFNTLDPRAGTDLNRQFKSQIFMMLDFAPALGQYRVQDLAPMVCQAIRDSGSASSKAA